MPGRVPGEGAFMYCDFVVWWCVDGVLPLSLVLEYLVVVICGTCDRYVLVARCGVPLLWGVIVDVLRAVDRCRRSGGFMLFAWFGFYFFIMPVFYRFPSSGPSSVEYVFADERSCRCWLKEGLDIKLAMKSMNRRFSDRGMLPEDEYERDADCRRWLDLVVDYGRRWTVDYVVSDIIESFDHASDHLGLRPFGSRFGTAVADVGRIDGLVSSPMVEFAGVHGEMCAIRLESLGADSDLVPGLLGRLRVLAGTRGFVFTDSLRQTVSDLEDKLARSGVRVDPLLRPSIPKLVYAAVELAHCRRDSAWRHRYQARNGDVQSDMGILPNRMSGFARNRLKFAEVTFLTLDNGPYTVRTKNIKLLRDWRALQEAFWVLADLCGRMCKANERLEFCRRLLDEMEPHIGRCHALFTPSLRVLVHEVQDILGVSRTVFQPVV